MADIIRTIKTDYKNKNLTINNCKLVSLDGEIVDIVSELHKVYGDNMFDLSVSRSEKEELDISDLDTDEDE